MNDERLKELGIEKEHWDFLSAIKESNGYDFYCNNQDKFTEHEKDELIRELIYQVENYEKFSKPRFIHDLLEHWTWCFDENSDKSNAIIFELYFKNNIDKAIAFIEQEESEDEE